MPEGVGYGPQNTASVGLTLNYIGNHVYAYSGTFGSLDSSQVMLSFQTANVYIKGTFTFNAPIRLTVASAGGAAVYQIKLNDVVVALGKADSRDLRVDAMPPVRELIIPPLTTVELIGRCEEDNANELITATFVGRIYGKIV